MSALERCTAWLRRLSFRGLLEKCVPKDVRRSGQATAVTFYWLLPDTQDPDAGWEAEVVVRLRDEESEEEWARKLLCAFADTAGHELAEALLVDGVAVADPHARPRVWPWRPVDRGEA